MPAVRNSTAISRRNVNTVHENVMTKREVWSIMNKEYIDNIYAYSLSMRMAKSMQKRGIISVKDYVKIDKIIANKYGIISCSLFRENA